MDEIESELITQLITDYTIDAADNSRGFSSRNFCHQKTARVAQGVGYSKPNLKFLENPLSLIMKNTKRRNKTMTQSSEVRSCVMPKIKNKKECSPRIKRQKILNYVNFDISQRALSGRALKDMAEQ